MATARFTGEMVQEAIENQDPARLKGGVYLVSETIRIGGAGVSLLGGGRTELRWVGTGPGPILEVDGNGGVFWYREISGLQLNGQNSGVAGMVVKRWSACSRISDIVIRGCSPALDIDNADEAIIQNLRFLRCGSPTGQPVVAFHGFADGIVENLSWQHCDGSDGLPVGGELLAILGEKSSRARGGTYRQLRFDYCAPAANFPAIRLGDARATICTRLEDVRFENNKMPLAGCDQALVEVLNCEGCVLDNIHAWAKPGMVPAACLVRERRTLPAGRPANRITGLWADGAAVRGTLEVLVGN